MTILPLPDEATCAQIAMALDSMPRERATEVLQRSATRYFGAALAKGWSASEAGDLTGSFVTAILRHWEAAALARMH